MPKADREAYNAYMKDYRRRRRENGGQPLGSRWNRVTHAACDAEIETLRKRITDLEIENRDLRELLPF
jgi:hypothetical protein